MNLELKNKITSSIKEQFAKYDNDGYIDLLNLYTIKRENKINFEEKIAEKIIDANTNYEVDLYKFDENLGIDGDYPISEIIDDVVYIWLKEKVIENMGALNVLFDSSFLEEDYRLHHEVQSWLENYGANND